MSPFLELPSSVHDVMFNMLTAPTNDGIPSKYVGWSGSNEIVR